MARERINLDDLVNEEATPITLNGKEYDIVPAPGDVYESAAAAGKAGTFGFNEMCYVVEKCLRPPISPEEVRKLYYTQLIFISATATGTIKQVEDQIVPLSQGGEQEVKESQAIES